MEYKILICESCDNVVSVHDNNKPTFICPACGTINERDRFKKYRGVLTIVSDEIDCRLDNTDNSGRVGIHDIEEDLAEALSILIKYGWNMKFKGDRLDGDD